MSIKQRINLSLPAETLRLLDRVAPKGDRSQVVNQAVRSYLGQQAQAKLRQRLKEGALAWADRDLALAEEWLLLDDN